MAQEKLFEVATRSKMRFPYKGLVSVEDLWDLKVEQLDSIFKTLNGELKQVTEESLLQVKTPADKELETKIEIIKYIVEVKQEEAKARLQAKELKEKKEKIMEAIATQEEKEFLNKSPEELRAMLAEIEAK
jgi:N-acetylmuramic acid 6-phosphate (MurNAc-6-P) etherase